MRDKKNPRCNSRDSSTGITFDRLLNISTKKRDDSGGDGNLQLQLYGKAYSCGSIPEKEKVP